jgi:hypothetical protein
MCVHAGQKRHSSKKTFKAFISFHQAFINYTARRKLLSSPFISFHQLSSAFIRHSSKKTFKFPFHQLSSAFISFHQLSSTIQLEEDFQVPLPSRSRPPVPSHPQITRTRPTNPHGARRSCVEENPAGTVEQQHHGFNGRKSLQTKQKDLPPTHRKEVLA